MKLGIIGAMSIEVETLKAQLTDLAVTEQTGMTFYDGSLDGLPAVIVECGVGKVNAALCVQILCDRFGVSHIVNTGVAGSLCNDLDIGDFVISQDVMYHDFDCSPMGYALGQVPGLPVCRFAADETLCSYALRATEQISDAHALIGTVASGDQFVSSREVKSRIVEITGALCTEMEGAAIAHAAWRNNVPFAVIRAISDKADDSAQMDYPTFEVIAAHRCALLVQSLAKQLKDAN